MKHATPTKYFDADDLDLMEKALSLYSDLDFVTYLAKRARQRVEYPIRNYEDLLPLCDEGSNNVTFKQHTITIGQAKRFLPEAFFPIESEEELLFKFFIAFTIEQQSQFPNRVYIPPLQVFQELPAEAMMFRPSPSATLFK